MENSRNISDERGDGVEQQPGIVNENQNDSLYFVDENQEQPEIILNQPNNNEIHQVLDEQSIQQLVESGTVSEDSIIAIVQNDNGDPQTVVLSRQEAEAFGIQLDPVDPSNQSEAREEQISTESSSEEKQLVPSHSFAPDQQEQKIPPSETTNSVPVNGEEQQTTVSLDSVPDDGEDGTAKDVLSNIIQSLFNPNEPNHSNISIAPRMVGGKRKLCLRLPASTASALLAQTGSSLATSFQEGGIPKKIKIVIPPSAVTSTTSSVAEQKVIKVSMHGNQSLKATQETKSPVKSSKPFLASLFGGSTE